MEISREELKTVVRDTVKETLSSLGVDTTDPLAMQADFHALREFRTSMGAVRKKALTAAVGIVMSGVIAAIVLGVKSWLFD
jgi:hypothetical protein